MVMTKEYYLSLASDVLRQLNVDGLYLQDCEEETLSKVKINSCEVLCGASKLVLVPFDSDYVIKIPFLGRGYECSGCIYDNIDPETGHICERNCNECPYNYLAQEYENYTCAHDEISSWDYCAVEADLYISACEECVEEFFIETTCIGYIHEHPIYLQYRIEVGRSDKITPSQDSKTFFEENGDGVMNMEMGANFIDFYGCDRFLDLVHFLRDYQIDDLHAGNLGFLGIQPVIIDYSGFND